MVHPFLWFVLWSGGGLIACKSNKELHEKPAATSPQTEYKRTFYEAVRAKTKGDADRAVALFEKCSALQPQSGTVHFALSRLYRQQGTADRALFHARAAYESDAKRTWYVSHLAELYDEIERYEESVPLYRQLVEQRPSAAAKWQYAQALERTHRYKASLEVLAAIEKEGGKSCRLTIAQHRLHLELGDEAAAQREWQEAIAHPNYSLTDYLTIADYLMQRGRTDEAEQLIREVRLLQPNNGQVAVTMAALLFEKGDVLAALQQLAQQVDETARSRSKKVALLHAAQPFAFDGSSAAPAIEKQIGQLFEQLTAPPLENDTLCAAYASFLHRQNATQKAAQYYQKAVAINPNRYADWVTLLQLYRANERFATLYTSGQQAMALFPTQPMVYLLSGIAARETGRWEEAESWLRLGKSRVINDSSLQADFLLQLGTCRCLQNDVEQAKAHFDKANQVDPSNKSIVVAEAFCRAEKSALEEGISQLEDALREAADDPLLLDGIAVLYLRSGAHDKAQTALQNALLHAPDNPVIAEHLGDVALQLGNPRQALEYWQKAQQLGRYTDGLAKKIANRDDHAN